MNRVPVQDFKNKDVLEVGLGYGTLSQVLLEHSKTYTGLDIAQGPVDMVNIRMKSKATATAVQGSIKEAPFKDDSFDVVVAIGCYHHTGDLEKAIEETNRILRDGGRCYLMVYNKFSYRMWRRWPFETFVNYMSNRRVRYEDNIEQQSKASDTNSSGDGAPETQYYSVKELRNIMSKHFVNLSFHKENVDEMRRFKGLNPFNRMNTLGTLGRLGGLDIYFSGEKKTT